MQHAVSLDAKFVNPIQNKDNNGTVGGVVEMKAFGITDCGLVRKENQDCFRFRLEEQEELLTSVLCDGMGGAAAGNIAAQLAAESFLSRATNSIDALSSFSDMNDIALEAVRFANQRVYDKSFSDYSCLGMGSTLVALLVNRKKVIIANVGDSRAYLISGSSIRQITSDHTLLNEMKRNGQAAVTPPDKLPGKNIITRAIGVEPSVKCDVFKEKWSAGDRLLLCSDGLSNLLSDEEILQAVKISSDPENACRAMLAIALDRGASDNVSVFLAER